MNKWYKIIDDRYDVSIWCYKIELIYNFYDNDIGCLNIYLNPDDNNIYFSTSNIPKQYIHPNNVPENIKKQILEHIEDPMFEIEVEKFIQKHDLKRDWWNYELR